ncbi:MAG: ABC transporter permease [Bacteroidales bacterium]|nr:ABC transporter permease [Bacteroidales bacterium]
MLGNFLISGFRILLRQRSYTFLNIIGLSLGIAVFIFIFLYIQSEIRYDRHWTDENRIYRVSTEFSLDGRIEKLAMTPFRLAEDLRSEFPGIPASTSILFTDPSDVNDVYSLIYEDEVFEVPDVTIGDSMLFRIFDYDFIEGNPETALIEPQSMVISLAVARKIFGNKAALGKKVKTLIREYTITGVFDKQQSPSHLVFDAVVSVSTLPENELSSHRADWFRLVWYTYFKVADTVDPSRLESRINQFTDEKISTFIRERDLQVQGYTHYNIEPITEVHFNTALNYDSPTNIDKGYLYIFGIIAVFILLTASINYINLATARSLKRAREIGVRKVLGAFKKQLMLQYMSESFILTFIAFIFALSLVELLMPQFNTLVGKNLTLVGSLFSSDGLFFGVLLILLIFLLSLISGSFPAFILTALRPVNVLKGSNEIVGKSGKQHFSAARLRKLLVSIQFFVSFGMIVATLIIYQQMHFLRGHYLGFEQEGVVVINVPQDTTYWRRAPEFIDALQKNEWVQAVSAPSDLPGYTHGKRVFYVGDTNTAVLKTLSTFAVDYDFFKLLDIPVLEGRCFSRDFHDDTALRLILNEAAVDYLRLDTAVGTMFTLPQSASGEVVGVVKDFNYSSLHEKVEPLVIFLKPKWSRYILVKIDEGNKNAAIGQVAETWQNFNEGHFMHYTFLDQKLESLYSGDLKMLSLFFYFSAFVIFISGLGLYGLSSFLIEQRSKEIGIRKVLGGSERQITFMLARNYLKLVLLSAVLASPLVYYLMSRWMDTFAYRIAINGWDFALGILLTLSIALATVLIRSFKIVRQSPSLSLRYQ